jgi:hypothetical protein
MQTASAAQAIIPCVQPSDKKIRWFSATGCVVYEPEAVEVYVGGTLIGSYAPKDKPARDLLLVGLAQDRNAKKGKLAQAFGIGPERLRLICRKVEKRGLSAVYRRIERRGRKRLVTPVVRRKLYKLFNAGMTVRDAFEECGKEAGLGRSTVGCVRKEWAAKRKPAPVQLRLNAEEREAEPAAPEQDGAEAKATPSDSGAVAGKLDSGRQVQHVGGWLLVAAVHALGLHTAIGGQLKDGKRLLDRLRVAVDAVLLALGLGQRCVEGVRRLQTPTAAVLLRTKNAPSESWTRRVLKDYVTKTKPFWLHMTMMQIYLERARLQSRGPAVFYVDNHMRPYTGKHTVRKGWRMQDKHVRPGATDYSVHDEDGRPVYRFEAPSNDSLTKWLTPVTMFLRAALGEEQRILLVFDRAGAFPQQLMELRKNNFEFVTYERRPYPLLSGTAFDEQVVVEKRGEPEVIGVHESRNKNLGKGRGRVRRIALRMDDGHQVNLLAVSEEPKERLIELMLGRWVQENGFKHANERWGINQLDGRQVEPYPPETIIPNPARRRLDVALRTARQREGDALRLLARLDRKDPKRAKVEQDLADSLTMQWDLEAQRPHVPKHAPLEETELKDKLVYHPGAYKTVLDTIRIAAANAEAELAAVLAPHLRRPREAKKALANLFSAPGDVRVNDKSITVTLSPAGTANEQQAFQALFQVVNRWRMTLPGDEKRRPLRFRSQLS